MWNDKSNCNENTIYPKMIEFNGQIASTQELCERWSHLGECTLGNGDASLTGSTTHLINGPLIQYTEI